MLNVALALPMLSNRQRTVDADGRRGKQAEVDRRRFQGSSRIHRVPDMSLPAPTEFIRAAPDSSARPCWLAVLTTSDFN